MKNKILALALTLSFLSCKNENPNVYLKLDCESIKELMDRDQELRKTKLQGQFFPLVDSIMKSKGFADGLDELSEIDSEMKSEIQAEAKSLKRSYTEREKQVLDSLWAIQNEIDSLNTLHVINQIEAFGIDSLNAIDRKCDENSLVIFVHCPDGLKEKVSEVVEKNRDAIGENRYSHISWHLKGR